MELTFTVSLKAKMAPVIVTSKGISFRGRGKIGS